MTFWGLAKIRAKRDKTMNRKVLESGDFPSFTFVPETIEVAAATGGMQFMPEVEAMLDESVLVLETDNEDVVVFWFYQGRGE